MSILVHIADRVLNRPLMILPDKLALIGSVLEGRIGIDAANLKGDDEVLAALGRPEASRFEGQFVPIDPHDPRAGTKPYRTTDRGVALIPVLGSLVNRGAWVGARSGLTSYEGLKFQIGKAAADDDVSKIILDIDSPGGEAVGAFEVADVVRDAAAVKTVVAVVNGMAASAAYAIAAAATKIVTTGSGIAGSIGVVMLHADYSHRLHEAGVKPTLIHAGARKVDGNPYQPLTDDVKAELKAEIENFYSLFVSSVVKGRSGLSEDAVRATEARTYIGKAAVDIGLADAIGSFETVLAELNQAHVGRSSTSRRLSMADKTAPDAKSGMTNVEVDAAVASARTEGHAAGVTEGKKEMDVAVANAKAEGVKGERERIKAITSLEEAKGREPQALAIALTTDMSADQAKAVLAVSPKAAIAPAGERASGSPLGLAVEQPGKPAASDAMTPEEVAASVNKQFGAKK